MNNKGGCGKSTSTMFLASAIAQRGMTVEVRDSDPQQTTWKWSQRAAEDAELPFPIVRAKPDELAQPTQAQWLIIDTAPGNPKVMEAAVEVADFVIVPTKATMLDLDSTWNASRFLESQGKPYAVLIIMGRRGTKNLQTMTELLEEHEVSYFDEIIPLREDIIAQGSQIPTRLYGYENVLRELEESI